MFDLVSNNGLIQTMDHTMTLASRRMALIASNLANIDTPGYHAQDFDFSGTLKSELTKLDGSQMPVTRTHPKHFPIQADSGVAPTTGSSNPAYERNDGNDVSLDHESMNLAKTQTFYQLSSSFAQTELRKLYLLTRS